MLIYNNLYRHVICACYGHVKTKATWLIFWFWILTTVHKLNQLDYIYLFYLRLYHQLTIHYQVKIIRSFLSTIFLIKMIKILRPNCLQIYLCRWQIWLFYFHGTLLFPSTWFRIKSIYLGRGGGFSLDLRHTHLTIFWLLTIRLKFLSFFQSGRYVLKSLLTLHYTLWYMYDV